MPVEKPRGGLTRIVLVVADPGTIGVMLSRISGEADAKKEERVDAERD